MNNTLILITTKNNSGGNTEISYFIKKLDSYGHKINVKYLFSKKPKLNHYREIIQIIKEWYLILKISKEAKNIILTHYSTLFFAFLFLHNRKLTIFIQSAEWKLISKFQII